MSRRARIWIGGTIIFAVVINYAIIGLPIVNKEVAIQKKYQELIVRKAKSDNPIETYGDDYLLDILRREKMSLDRKLQILNVVTATVSIFALSWIVFGLLFIRRSKKLSR